MAHEKCKGRAGPLENGPQIARISSVLNSFAEIAMKRNGTNETSDAVSTGLAAVGGTAAGAAAGSLFGPVGAAVGAVLGGVAGTKKGAIAKKLPAVKKSIRRMMGANKGSVGTISKPSKVSRSIRKTGKKSAVRKGR
jgi:hypothetical protein